MSHTAGLPGWSEPITVEDLYDWEKATSLLAAQEPWWEPGTASGYHAITQGYLEGEVVRRVTGQTIGEFVAEEIAGPLGADFHIGTRPSTTPASPTSSRPSVPLTPTSVEPGSIAADRPVLPLDAAGGEHDPVAARRDPAAGGHGNARSVALVHAPMACGGEANGVRLLSPTGADPVFDEQGYGQDLVLPLTCATASASGCRARRCRSAPTSGRASGAAGAARWRSSTSTPDDLRLRDEQDGRGPTATCGPPPSSPPPTALALTPRPPC